MSFESAIYTLLTDQDGLLHPLVGNQVYPEIAPQETSGSYIVYSLLHEERSHHTKGPSGVVQAYVQFDTWAETSKQAGVIADALRNQIDGYTGISDEVQICQCHMKDRRSDLELSVGGEEKHKHRKIVDFKIGYYESLPDVINPFFDWVDSASNNLITHTGDRIVFKQQR